MRVPVGGLPLSSAARDAAPSLAAGTAAAACQGLRRLSRARAEIVLAPATWGIAGEAVPAASGVVASPGREGGAGAAQRGSRRWLVESARTAPAAGGILAERKALRNRHVPAGQLPEGARVIMPPGPCVPFPGAGGTFPPARRPAARSPSEAAVATRTPSGASARTIGIVGIKCQEALRRRVTPPVLAHRPSSGLRPPSPASGRRVDARTTPLPCAAWERVPEGRVRARATARVAATGAGAPALIRRSRATFSRKREKGPASIAFSRRREKDDGRSSLRASAGTDDDGIATCTDYFRYFFVWYVSASSMTSTMRSTCWRVRTRGGEMMKVS